MMRARWMALALAMFAGAANAQQIAVKAGVSVKPDTVRIGDAFRVTVGVQAPRGATIEFPRTADSTGAVQSLDPVAVRTSADTTSVEQFAEYRVAAWDVGAQPIRLDDALVTLNGATRRVPLGGYSVYVRSLLPKDTTLRVPKPPRPVFEVSVFPWWILAVIAAAIAIGLLIWLRRRRRGPIEVDVDPFVRAESEFQRVEGLGLLEAGERGRYVTLMIEVLRDYLAARYTEASLALTTSELDRAAARLPFVPQERLARLLIDTDLVKFARRPLSTERAREMGREARAIVLDEHTASQPAPAQEKAA